MNTAHAEPVRLTQYSHGAGCGCKIAPAQLEVILRSSIGTLPDANLLVGYGSRDDAAVYAIGEGRCIITTTDFFSPIVDDAFTFGRIAAANALSDVFAMGGKPLVAVAILGWPVEKLGAELAQRVVEGGRTACHEVGIPLAGGHSIDAPEPFFGLAVTGMVPVANIKRNNTATPGLTLLLTKPIGTGILSTAMKRGKLKADDEVTLVRQLCAMNSAGALLGGIAGVKAMTDVTGFGLMGHLLELCDGSGVNARLWFDRIPLLSSVNTYLTEGCYPDGAFRNWKAYNDRCTGANDMTRMMVLSDPQTNGGLLIAVEPDSVEHAQDLIRSITGGPAAMIGETLPPGNQKPVEVV